MCIRDRFDGDRVMNSLEHSGFTKSLSHGVNTELLREFDDEGVMLSGGESQKVAIARAFYKKCPYVIPVSYTHLDVYKRQALNPSFLMICRASRA